MDTNRYDIERIRKYLNSELSVRQMYELERQAESDPILMDMLIGMELAGNDEIHGVNLDEIRRRVNARASQRGAVRQWAPAWRKWAVAASILLLGGIGVFLVWRPAPDTSIPEEAQQELAAHSNFGEGAAKSVQEVVLAESIDSLQQQGVAVGQDNPTEQRISTRRGIRRRISEDKLASITRPEPALLPHELDTMPSRHLLDHVPSTIRADERLAVAAQSGTVILAARSETPIAEGKRLAMSIRSLPAGSLDSSSFRQVSGSVREEKSGMPLPGIAIFGANKQLYTHSGSDGKFSLVLPDKQDSLTVASVGYQTQTVDVRDHDAVIVWLAESPSPRQNETVAMERGYPDWGLARSRDTTAGKPRPINGWAEFDRYVQRSAVSLLGKGTVTLKFRIGTSGQPMNLQLDHTTNPALVKKAMDILLEGPRWERGSNAEGLVTVLIEFR